MFWSLFVQRIGAHPATIIIYDDNVTNRVEKLAECRLNQVIHIRHLCLKLIGSFYPRFGPSDFGPISVGSRITKLSIHYYEWHYPWEEFLPERSSPFITAANVRTSKLWGIMELFPTMNSFYVKSVSFPIDLPADPVFPNITSLKIRDAVNITLELLSEIFPNLIEAELDRATYAITDARVTWPKLRHLYVKCVRYGQGSYPLGWSSIYLPEIRTFYCSDLDANIMKFISRHPTIQYLDVPYVQEHFKLIAQHAPQLLSLRISPFCQEIFDTFEMPLENLEELVINAAEYANPPLSVGFIDKLIQNRILGFVRKDGEAEGELDTNPSRDPNLRHRSQRTLIIYSRPWTGQKARIWEQSRLIEGAREEITLEERRLQLEPPQIPVGLNSSLLLTTSLKKIVPYWDVFESTKFPNSGTGRELVYFGHMCNARPWKGYGLGRLGGGWRSGVNGYMISIERWIELGEDWVGNRLYVDKPIDERGVDRKTDNKLTNLDNNTRLFI